MLRTVLLWCGGLLLLGGVTVALVCHSPAGLGPAGFGAILLLAIRFERRGYKRIVDGVPGADWQPTGERFLDPNSELPVDVYFQPATGKRVYVRSAR
ncbi:MAG: hypothetical protein ABSC95_16715 [Acetobacteraceae bacterium]|jgi:hypothetical protein